MIDITKLYCGVNTLADGLRYGEKELDDICAFEVQKSSKYRKPIVVWNITRRCNLNCLHCYSNSKDINYENELTTNEAYHVIDNLHEYKVPVILFSGGEPLLRKDLFELAKYAKNKEIRLVLSTNGTLINEKTAHKIKETGFSYVGISLDGIGEVNDSFRGAIGAYDSAMQAFKLLSSVKQRVGLRMTLTKSNIDNLNSIFDLLEKENIDRVCFYHLVYTGRATHKEDISKEESRMAIEIILKRTKELFDKGKKIDVLTVDNHVDGVYIYLKLLKEDPQRAKIIYDKLLWNGGGLYSSGVGIGAIDFQGNVHPDQFWQHYSLGNVRLRKFSEIWEDLSDPIMKGLKDRKPMLKGRCTSCRWIDICGGSLRVRADKYYGDPWMEDPACYLSNDEIGAIQ